MMNVSLEVPRAPSSPISEYSHSKGGGKLPNNFTLSLLSAEPGTMRGAGRDQSRLESSLKFRARMQGGSIEPVTH
jgi:hypothetical protein